MRVNAGKIEHELLPRSQELATMAHERLGEMIAAVLGRPFYGQIGLTVIVQAGQITEVQPAIVEKVR
jgi:hypothetical protein